MCAARYLVPTVHVVAAVGTTAAIYFLLPDRAAATPDAVAHQLLRASGFAALVWAYVGLLIGLGASTRVLPRLGRIRRSTWVTLHRQLNLAALALAAVHLTSYVVAPGGSLLVALVPQTAEVGAFAYTLGVLAFYLALLLGPSWYLRHRIGRRTWLVAHQFAALSYAAGLWHTLLLGGDVRLEGSPRTALWMLQVPLLVLFVLRLVRPRRLSDHLDAGQRQSRFATARHVRLRFALHTGVVLAAFVVLGVALGAASDGQQPTRIPEPSGGP